MTSSHLIKKTHIYQGRIVKLETHDVALPTGVTTSLDVFEHPGASAVIPLDGEQVTLIRQFRYAAGGYLWEIPAGTLEKDEAPLACATRELEEEAGVTASSITPLGPIFTVPSFCTEIIHLFLAEGLTPTKTAHERDEVIDDIRQVPFRECLGMIARGEICDGKTIAGIVRAGQHKGFIPTM